MGLNTTRQLLTDCVYVDIIPLRPRFDIPTSEVQTALLTMTGETLENSEVDWITFVSSGFFLSTSLLQASTYFPPSSLNLAKHEKIGKP